MSKQKAAAKPRKAKAPKETVPALDLVTLASEQLGLGGDAARQRLLSHVTYVAIPTPGQYTGWELLPGGMLTELRKASPAVFDQTRHRELIASPDQAALARAEQQRAGYVLGPQQCRVMFITAWPGPDESKNKMLGASASAATLFDALDKSGIPRADVYYTSLVKHDVPQKGNTIDKQLIAAYLPLLREEIRQVNPELVVLVGSRVLKAVLGDKQTFDRLKGCVLPAELTGLGVPATVITDPSSILYKPENQQVLELDVARIHTQLYTNSVDEVVPEYHYCHSMQEFQPVLEQMRREACGYIAVDCEWAGSDYLIGRLRCLQMCWAPGKVAVLVFSHAAPDHSMAVVPTQLDSEPEVWGQLQQLFDTNGIIGHFIRADLPWLVKQGIAIDWAVCNGWDTGLAGHLLDENWEQGLETYVARHTRMGRYEQELNDWIRSSKLTSELIRKIGYASVPDAILLPYAAKDADATFRIFMVQYQELQKAENAALWRLYKEVVLPATLPILEMELTGMDLDVPRLEKLSQQFTVKTDELKAKLREILRWPAFNPDSSAQKVAALYGGTYNELKVISKAGAKPPDDANLGAFTPTKTTKATKKMKWDKAIAAYARMQLQANKLPFPKPATDKDQLKELIIQSPDSELLTTLRQYSAVSQIVKAFTGRYADSPVDDTEEVDEDEDDDDIAGGLLAKRWSDGKVHTRIRQTVETGRYGHKDPNMAQLPKTAEEFLDKIFANDAVKPVPIRSCFPAQEGWALLDSDWSSAELFVMAWLSGDQNMKNRLTKPNADFHSDVAIDIFKLQPKPADFKGDAKAWLKANGWSRFRTIAKTIVFGIAYGRGAAAVQQAVYLEGVKITEAEAKEAIAMFNQTFPELATWLAAQQASVTNPGYVVNGLGRRRRFAYTADNEVAAHQRRQAMNAPIQGTVGDLMSLALCNLYFIRALERPHLKFRLLMSVHDQILLTCPIDQIEETIEVFKIAMCDRCRIPGSDLILQADPEVCLRWGESLTPADAERYPALAPYVKTKG